MQHQRLEQPIQEPQAPKAVQVEIPFPEPETLQEDSAITKEEIDEVYKDDPKDPDVNKYGHW